ncbi:MAG: hypothetical protein IT373_02685 [Polyangiaceae bacterium]|nr:hypothetical protein [Polyangiaceae bacterium]
MSSPRCAGRSAPVPVSAPSSARRPRARRLVASGVTAVLVLAATVAHAQDRTPVPLARVRFYETGVGYFERAGTMPTGSLSLPVPAAHLDDALKTLVVLSPGGNVAGLEFASSVSRDMARALAGLGGAGDDGSGAEPHIGYDSLLRSLKGAAVELGTGQGKLEGRLVEVLGPEESAAERCVVRAPPPGAAPVTPDDAAAGHCVAERHGTVLVLTKDSEIRRIRTSDLVSVRPTDAGFKTRLGSALDALGEGGAKTARALSVHADAGKPIALGYVAEAPVWRSTFRLVLDAAAPTGVLQGWALIHNDTDEDWKQVKVELVNGQPESFLFPLAAPRYARRELRTPERELSTVPQLLDTTVDNMWSGSAGGLSLTGIGEGGGGRGEGIGLGSIGTIGHGSGYGSARLGESSALQVGNLAATAQAEGEEAAAMFLYAMPAPVDLHAHSSALLPFLSQGVSARRVAYFAAPGQPAESAVHLRNDTAQTLPAGTLAIFSDGGFAGEAGLARTKPREERIVRYGLDLDVELASSRSDATDLPQLFTFDNDVLVEHFVRMHADGYEIRNRSSTARTVYLTLRYGRNTDVQGADRIEFDEESGQALAVFEVGAQGDSARELEIREGLRQNHALGALDVKLLRGFAAAPAVPAEQRAALGRAADGLEARDRARADSGEVEVAIADLERDIERLRLSARAVEGGSDELAERLVAAEDRMGELAQKRKELLGLAQSHDKAWRVALASLGTRR